MSGGWTVVSEPKAPGAGGWQVVKPPSVTEHVDQAPKEDHPHGMLGRLWDSLTKPSGETKAGRFKMGVGDPAMGVEQIAARSYVSPMEGGNVEDLTPEMTRIADTTARQREQKYQEQRRQAVPGIRDPEARMAVPDLGTDWARLAGNVASPVNLATGAVPGGIGASAGRAAVAPIASRLASPLLQRALPAIGAGIGQGVLQGGVGAATQPVTGPNFAREKLGQVGTGMALGGALGGAGTGLSKAAGAALPAVRDFFGAAPRMSPEAANDLHIGQSFAQTFGLPTRGVNNAGDLKGALDQGTSVTKSIIEEKPNLRLTDPKGREVTGSLPRTFQQASEAVSQVKDKLFKLYDDMTKKADASAAVQPTPITKFQRTLAVATQRETQAQKDVADASRRLTQAAARQSQAGNVYSSSTANQAYRIAKRDLTDAESRLNQARVAKAGAQSNMRRPWVDLKPIAKELDVIANDGPTRLHNKAIADYAKKEAEAFRGEEAYTAAQAQNRIAQMNKSLEAYYANPSYGTALRAQVDAMIAHKMRQGLDQMIERAVGPGYQKLKLEYGAASAMEKQITRRALRQLNKGDQPGLADQLINATSGEEVIRGALSGDPAAIARGVILRGARGLERMWRNPDNQVRRFFEDAERRLKPPQPSGALRGAMTGVPLTGAGGAGVSYAWPQSP